MALPPDSGDSFIREVDENLQRDRARDFAKKNLPWIVAAVVLFLAAIGGYLYWQERKKAAAGEQSEALAQIFRDVGSPSQATVPPRLEQVASNGDDAVRATARFAKAAVALEGNDRKAAIAEYTRIAADDDVAEVYRNLATVRLTELEFDTIKPEEVIARMQPFNTAGNPWFGRAGELTAMAYLKQGKRAEAGPLFAAVAADRDVPDPIRSRAVQIAGTLGVDASASMPTLGAQPQAAQ